MHVTGYASKTLTPVKTKYPLYSGKLEFLALKWAITEYFQDNLFYALDFTIYTDNSLLTYVVTTAKLNLTEHRWVESLADFHFKIKYCTGLVHKDADFLLRMPTDISLISHLS